jgi:hypothetical protein
MFHRSVEVDILNSVFANVHVRSPLWFADYYSDCFAIALVL